jgi:hypothetical protein
MRRQLSFAEFSLLTAVLSLAVVVPILIVRAANETTHMRALKAAELEGRAYRDRDDVWHYYPITQNRRAATSD